MTKNALIFVAMIHTGLGEQHVSGVLPGLNRPIFSMQDSKEVWLKTTEESGNEWMDGKWNHKEIVIKDKAGIPV